MLPDYVEGCSTNLSSAYMMTLAVIGKSVEDTIAFDVLALVELEVKSYLSNIK
jgi:NifU-like protein involved in Fe-S cluster formation